MYKKIVKLWGLIVLIGMIGIFLVGIVVDPLELLGMPIINGINNSKVKQGSCLDVFKPYQVIKYKPEVVFIGSSRVKNACKPTLYGYDDDKVFNFAFNALSLKNMEKYLDFIYKVSEPKKIFIGLDFFQFGEENFKSGGGNFSENRLNILSSTNVKDSFKHKNKIVRFERGWREQGSNNINVEDYYNYMNSFAKQYDEWNYSREALEVFNRIIEKARTKNVDVIVYFNPISVDLIALIYACGLENELASIKEKVVKITGKVYDFNYINTYTCSRKEYFIDPSHCKNNFGEIIKSDICLDKNTDRMVILNSDNIQNSLFIEANENKIWLKNNFQYINFLRGKINNKTRIKDNELKKYIDI